MSRRIFIPYLILSLSIFSLISFPIVFAQNPIVNFFRKFIFRELYFDYDGDGIEDSKDPCPADYFNTCSSGTGGTGTGGTSGGLDFCLSDGVTVCGIYDSSRGCTYPCTGSGGTTSPISTPEACYCDVGPSGFGSCTSACGSKAYSSCFDNSECTVGASGGGTPSTPGSGTPSGLCSCENIDYSTGLGTCSAGCESGIGINNKICSRSAECKPISGGGTPTPSGAGRCKNPLGTPPTNTCKNFGGLECPTNAGCIANWFWASCYGDINNCENLDDANSCTRAGCIWPSCTSASLSFDKSRYLPGEQVNPRISTSGCAYSSFSINMDPNCRTDLVSSCSSTYCTPFTAPTYSSTYYLCESGANIASASLEVSSTSPSCGNSIVDYDKGEECDPPYGIVSSCTSGGRAGYIYCTDQCKKGICQTSSTPPADCSVGGLTPSVSPTSIKQGDPVTVSMSNLPSACSSYHIYFQQFDRTPSTSDYGNWNGALPSGTKSFLRSGLKFPDFWGQGTFYVFVWVDNGDLIPQPLEYTRKVAVTIGSRQQPSCSIDPPSVKQSVSSGTLRQPFVVTFVDPPPVRDVEVNCASPYQPLKAPLDQSTGKATFTCIYTARGKYTVTARAGGVQCTASVEITDTTTVKSLTNKVVKAGVFRSQIPETEGCTEQIYLAKGENVLTKTVISTSNYIEYSPISDGVVKVIGFCISPTVSIYKSFVTVSKSATSSPSLSCSKSEDSITCNWSNCQISSGGLNEIAIASAPNFLESKQVTQDSGSETFGNLASGSYTALLTCENGDLFQQLTV